MNPTSASAQQSWAQEFASGKVFREQAFATPDSLGRMQSDGFFKLLQRFLKPGGRALETGFGYGNYCFLLAEAHRSSSVLGIDCVAPLVSKIESHREEYFPHLTNSLKFECADLFTFRGEKADLVFSNGVYEHFLDSAERLRALNSFSENLSDDGFLIVAVPNLSNPLFHLAARGDVPTMVSLGFEQLSAELEAANFVVCEMGDLFVAPGFEQWVRSRVLLPLLYGLVNIYPNLPRAIRRIFSAHIYCVAKKRGAK